MPREQRLDVKRLEVLLRCLPALLALTDIERETYVDVHLLSVSQREIADREGVSNACISQRLVRAQRKVEAAVAAANPEAIAA